MACLLMNRMFVSNASRLAGSIPLRAGSDVFQIFSRYKPAAVQSMAWWTIPMFDVRVHQMVIIHTALSEPIRIRGNSDRNIS